MTFEKILSMYGFVKEAKESPNMSPKEYLKRAVNSAKAAMKSHRSLEANFRAIAKSAGDDSPHYVAVADEHARMAAAHDQHVEQLGALVNHAPDVWPLGGWTIGPEGQAVNGPRGGEKVAKVVDEFWDRFYQGRPETLRKVENLDS